MEREVLVEEVRSLKDTLRVSQTLLLFPTAFPPTAFPPSLSVTAETGIEEDILRPHTNPSLLL